MPWGLFFVWQCFQLLTLQIMATKKNVSMTPNERQKRFVEFYAGEANFNATKAAKMAGYASPRVEGCRLKKRKDVAQAIAERVQSRAMGNDEILARFADIARATFAPFIFGNDDDGPLIVDRELDPPELAAAKELLARVDAPADSPDRLSWNDPTPDEIEDAKKLVEAAPIEKPTDEIELNLSSRAARANLHLIREVRHTKKKTTSTKNGAEVVDEFATTTLKLHDSLHALKWLGQAAGLIKDNGSELLKMVDVSKLSTRQLERLKAGEPLVKIILSPDADDGLPAADHAEVEDDLPDAN